MGARVAGVRWLGGREFLLCGRVSSRAAARFEQEHLRLEWDRVRMIKLSDFDFMLYVHGRKGGQQ